MQQQQGDDEPASSKWIVSKRPRGTIVVSGWKSRMVVLHRGHLRYYKHDSKTMVYSTVPFVNFSPQGDMTGGVVGCTATLEPEGSNKSAVVKIQAVNGKDLDITLQFQDRTSACAFIVAFKKQHDYYENHKIPALKPEEW